MRLSSRPTSSLNAENVRHLPRLALRCPDEAATAIGVSSDFFDAHVRPEVRVVRRARLIFVSVRELEHWLDCNGARAIG
jgi:hypothetical protein